MRQEWPIKPSWIIRFFRPMACEPSMAWSPCCPMVNLERFLSRWINRWIGEFYFQRNPGKKILLNIYSFGIFIPRFIRRVIYYSVSTIVRFWKPSDIIFILFHVIDNILYCISKFPGCNVSFDSFFSRIISPFLLFFSLHCPRSRTICLNSSRIQMILSKWFFSACSNTSDIETIYIFLPSRKSRILFPYRRFHILCASCIRNDLLLRRIIKLCKILLFSPKDFLATTYLVSLFSI